CHSAQNIIVVAVGGRAAARSAPLEARNTAVKSSLAEAGLIAQPFGKSHGMYHRISAYLAGIDAGKLTAYIVAVALVFYAAETLAHQPAQVIGIEVRNHLPGFLIYFLFCYKQLAGIFVIVVPYLYFGTRFIGEGCIKG